MVHELVMEFGWLECVVVVYAFHSSLEQGVGHLKQPWISDVDFALKPGHGHARQNLYEIIGSVDVVERFSTAIRVSLCSFPTT